MPQPRYFLENALRASSRIFTRWAAELGTGKTAPDVFKTVADELIPLDFEDADFTGANFDELAWLELADFSTEDDPP